MNHRSLKTIIIACIGIILSLVLLYFYTVLSIDPAMKGNFWVGLMSNIASTLMVASTIGIIVDVTTKSDVIQIVSELSQKVNTMNALNKLGLKEVFVDSNVISHRPILEDGRKIVIVINDGRSWLTRNAELVRNRLKKEKLETTFIFLHPESGMLQIQAKKTNQTPEFLKEKVLGTIEELRGFERVSSHKLSILGHDLYHVHSVFLSEDTLILTNYLNSPGRNTIPGFVYQKSGPESLYDKFYQDIEELKKVSREIVSS